MGDIISLKGPEVEDLSARVRGGLAQGKTLEEAVHNVRVQLAEAVRLATEQALREEGEMASESCPPTLPCMCGASQLRLSGKHRRRTLEMEIGTVSFGRPYYAPGNRCDCPGRWPLDERLQLPTGRVSRGLTAAVCLLVAMVPFERATDLLRRLVGFTMSKKRAVTLVGKVAAAAYAQHTERATQRWKDRDKLIEGRPALEKRRGRLFVLVDGTGVGIKKSDEFRECKSAVLFWESDLKEVRHRNKRRRRPAQRILRKRIVSHIGSHETFLPYLWDAFVDVGGLGAEQVIWIGDGAEWLWNDSVRMLPDEHFDVIELLDWYHLFQNLWKVARLVSDDREEQEQWIGARKREMRRRDTGRGLAGLLSDLAKAEPKGSDRRHTIETVRDYVIASQNRMRYAEFRARNWPRGSAAIESVQHGVIQARFKLPGMRWTVEGANRMLRLRNAYFSGCWDQVFDDAFGSLQRQSQPQATAVALAEAA